jgi:hypothetical protein
MLSGTVGEMPAGAVTSEVPEVSFGTVMVALQPEQVIGVPA